MTTADSHQLVVTPETIESLIKRAEDGELVYAIIDACDEPRVPIMVTKIGNDRAASLFSGHEAIEYASIAPYIVRVDQDWIRWIGNELEETPWGFFFVVDSTHDFAAIRRHWKRFLKAQIPDGRKLYFRFYDPRVLGTFLNSSTAVELDQFFGPVEDICIVHSNNKMSSYRRAVRAFDRSP